MEEIAIVILNYNGVKFLENFLPNVIQFSPKNEIYVADNQSTDNSIEFLKTNFPKVNLIVNKTNINILSKSCGCILLLLFPLLGHIKGNL